MHSRYQVSRFCDVVLFANFKSDMRENSKFCSYLDTDSVIARNSNLSCYKKMISSLFRNHFVRFKLFLTWLSLLFYLISHIFYVLKQTRWRVTFANLHLNMLATELESSQTRSISTIYLNSLKFCLFVFLIMIFQRTKNCFRFIGTLKGNNFARYARVLCRLPLHRYRETLKSCTTCIYSRFTKINLRKFELNIRIQNNLCVHLHMAAQRFG